MACAVVGGPRVDNTLVQRSDAEEKTVRAENSLSAVTAASEPRPTTRRRVPRGLKTTHRYSIVTRAVNVHPPVTSGEGRAGPLTTGLKSGSAKRLRYLCTDLKLAQTVSKWTYWPPFDVTKGRTLLAIVG